MMDVVGIGSAVFDILMTAEGFPKEDTKMQGKETKLQCGGPCATALVAMSKLGVSSGYVGTLGDDMYGSGKGMERHALHCSRMSFEDEEGNLQTVESPLPPDMEALARQSGLLE